MKFIVDISKKTCILEKNKLNSYSLDIYVGFLDNGKLPVTFDDMSMHCELNFEGKKIFEEKKPPLGIVYSNTDQEYIEVFTIENLFPDNEYKLNIWAKNSGEIFKKSDTVILPRPPAPYPSWTYNTDKHIWEPPVERPKNDIMYEWNEELKQWDVFNNGIV